MSSHVKITETLNNNYRSIIKEPQLKLQKVCSVASQILRIRWTDLLRNAKAISAQKRERKHQAKKHCFFLFGFWFLQILFSRISYLQVLMKLHTLMMYQLTLLKQVSIYPCIRTFNCKTPCTWFPCRISKLKNGYLTEQEKR